MILLLIPSTVTIGAVLALGTITGAIFSHLTKLGIVVKDDGGLLFILAVTVHVVVDLSVICLIWLHDRILQSESNSEPELKYKT